MTSSIFIDVSLIPDRLAGLVAITRGIALSLVLLIFVVAVLKANVRSLEGDAPRYDALFLRLFIAFSCLITYQQMANFILKSAQAMSFAILSEEDWGNFIAQGLRAKDPSSPIFSAFAHPLASLQSGILFGTTLLVVLVKEVLVYVQALMLGVLFTFGPIAIVCSIDRSTSQVTRGWLASSIQVSLWTFFLRMTMRIWLTLNPMANSIGTGFLGNANDLVGILTINATFLILVIGTVLLSDRLVSGQSLAALGEAALGAVAAVGVVKALRAGKVVSDSIVAYRRAPLETRQSLFHYPGRAMARGILHSAKKMREARMPKRTNDNDQTA